MKASWSRLAQGARQATTEAYASVGPYAWVNPSAPSTSATGVLAGRAIAIKDNISYSGAPTECSSRILQGYVPPYDATCVRRLLDAGAHIAGKTKMDEFGMGSENTHMPPYYGPVHNRAGPGGPRSAGGSSGGSAAAVANGSAWAALGTDTGGSVRLPASFCGVVGLKPSYGLVSRYGVVAYADTLDCVGVLGGSVDVVETVFGVVSGPDAADMTCASAEARERARANVDKTPHLDGLRVGLPIQTHVEGAWQIPESLLRHLRDMGVQLVPVDMPALNLALPAYYVLALAEAASNLGRFGGGWYGAEWEKEPGKPGESGAARRKRVRSEGFGYETRKRLLAGTHALTSDAFNNSYLKALALKRILQREYAAVFRAQHPLSSYPAADAAKGVDVLLHPTAVGPAPAHDDDSPPAPAEEYLSDILTGSANLAGLPALSVSAGTVDGWPVGVSILGQWGMEDVLFRTGRAIEAWKP